MVRLQKYLADCGICSRRKAEEYIKNGFVKVNGDVITEQGVKIDEKKDSVLFKNKPIKMSTKKVYILFNKPKGCVTTSKDQFNRKTVLDYVDIKERVVPVGRLDYDTTGLLLLTNDGDLTFKLTHPKHNMKKKYIAKVYGSPTNDKLDKLRDGITIDDYKTSPANIKIISRDKRTSTIQVSIREGRNRQVRKMFETIGYRVFQLERIAIENLTIGDLEIGKYRYLTSDEIKYLRGLS